MGLDGRPDVAEPSPGHGRRHGPGERLAGSRHQPAGRGNHPAHLHRLGGIAVESGQHGPEVETDDVPVPQEPARRRDPVDDLVVHRDADARRVAEVPLERRCRSPLPGARLRQPVELAGGDPGLGGPRDLVKDGADDPSRLANSGDVVCRLQLHCVYRTFLPRLQGGRYGERPSSLFAAARMSSTSDRVSLAMLNRFFMSRKQAG